jgi:CRP/FNR family cyclic AMP-dependent transcriptional regulator
MRTPSYTPQAAVLNLLGQVPLFRPLDDSERFEIVRILQPLSHSAGVVLFRQGDPGDRFFVIESGEVEVGFDGADGLEVIARLGPAEVLGEMSLIEGGPRSATARTITPVTGYSIAIADFDRLRRDLHPAAYKIIRQLSRIVAQRIRRVN